ncbi:MAG TPA: polysaccharide biosynthesis/export family protein [Vicinamibacterales bacterium]|jgi:polysaccharide export outer membrane protein|nr:polysaccharide biosynthesis/export family protein [Vicinamibacterales bacterium]
MIRPSHIARAWYLSLKHLGGPLVTVALIGAVAAAEPPKVTDYVVGPNDVLAVTVVDQPQLTGKYIVRADGTFTFPMLGRLSAGGLSLQAVENDIHDRLAKGYLKDPQVGVSVEVYRSQQIFVIGEVRLPGSFQFTGSMRLIEALARAGSTTDRAGADAVIVRPKNGASANGGPPALDEAAIDRTASSADAEVIRINLQDLQGGALSENVALRSGDTVFVPRAKTVFVAGQVRSPGEYVIRKDMTVRQVLTVAGGVTDRGSTRRIQIVRQVNGVETKIAANLEDIVQPGDNIVVRDRLF